MTAEDLAYETSATARAVIARARRSASSNQLERNALAERFLACDRQP